MTYGGLGRPNRIKRRLTDGSSRRLILLLNDQPPTRTRPLALWRHEVAAAQVSQTNPSNTQQVPADLQVVDLYELFSV